MRLKAAAAAQLAHTHVNVSGGEKKKGRVHSRGFPSSCQPDSLNARENLLVASSPMQVDAAVWTHESLFDRVSIESPFGFGETHKVVALLTQSCC
jgi:hypothetical protein